MQTNTSWTVDNVTVAQIAKTLDHSLLRPELTIDAVVEGCAIAARYDVASVCCRPLDVRLCVAELGGGDVVVGTVIGFPHGANLTATKVFEAERAMEDGATELDMVLAIGWLRSGELDYVRNDVQAVVDAGHAGGAIVKVILENAYLSDSEKIAGCQACAAAGANYVKTSTGFAPGGATLDDLRLMRATVPPEVKVKAAGGVRTLDALIDCLNAGIDRCGATATAVIIEDLRARQSHS